MYAITAQAKCTHMPHSARLRRSVGFAAGHGGGGRVCSREGTGCAAQRAGQPVPAGHAPDEVRRVARGIPAAVTNNGRAEDPRATGTAWVAVRNLDLTTPITGMPNPACACAPRPGRPLGSRSGVAAGTSRPSPLRSSRTARSGGSSRRRFSPGRQGGTRGRTAGAFGQQVREGGIGGEHGCRPGAAGAQVMHVHGGAHAAVRAPAGFRVLWMPEPATGIGTVFGQLPAGVRSRSNQSRSAIGLCEACARVTAVMLGNAPLVAALLWRARMGDLFGRFTPGSCRHKRSCVIRSPSANRWPPGISTTKSRRPHGWSARPVTIRAPRAAHCSCRSSTPVTPM